MKSVFFFFFTIVAINKSLLAQNWSELGIGIDALNANNTIGSICVDSGSIIYAVGDFTDSLLSTNGKKYVAKWDGTSWSVLGSGTNTLQSSHTIGSVCIDAAHNLYASGDSSDSDGYYYVSKWDGASWYELGTGINSLKANGLIEQIRVDILGNIYAAGAFTDGSADTTGYNYIAKWNGITWSELGTGSNALNRYGLNTFSVDSSGNVYAAGQFVDSGYYVVMKWNGTAWSKLGTGSNGLNANSTIAAICADAIGNVYVGGYFRDITGKYYVAKWNGTNWTEVGTDVNALNANGPINSIFIDASGNLFAAGSFTDINSKRFVAKWNGTNWAEVGTGVNALNANSFIFSICTDSKNNLYAAGDFSDSSNYYIYGHRYVAKYKNADANVTLLSSISMDVNVYPNPSNDAVFIEIPIDFISCEYIISTINGKKILEGKLESEITSIDISHFAKGIYMLQLYKNTCYEYKIIKE